MKRVLICIIVWVLWFLSYSYAEQTNVSFIILWTGAADTGSVDTGWDTGGGWWGRAGGWGIIDDDDFGSATGGDVDVIVPSTGEFPTVYERAHHYGLIEKKSQLYDTISRVEFAKMMTLFIENVRWQKITPNPLCDIKKYSDYAKIYWADRQFIKAACDIGLMWWNGDRTALISTYNPYQRVTRDQMATIFSRMLYGTTYDDADPVFWYKKHLYAIYKAGFVTKLDPKIVEDRINILTILQRIATVIPNGRVSPYKWSTPPKPPVVSDPELQIAYNRAKTNAITTLPAYDEKALYAPIARVELARMLVVFSKTVLGKVVTDRPVCQIENYKDYANISLSLRPYVQDACDLSIMGVSTTGALIEWFKPYSTVTRAEFGTVLSRMLYGSGYDTNNSEEWYLPHLEALSRDWYIHDITHPFMKELHGYILLILHRIAANSLHL